LKGGGEVRWVGAMARGAWVMRVCVCEGVVGPWYPTRERCLGIESRVRVRVRGRLCAAGRLVVRWYIVAALCC
jgi:hypothetical protein